MIALELHVELHRFIESQKCFYRFRLDRRNVVSVEKIVLFALMDRDVFLRVEVVFHRDISIEMILIEIEENGDMRREFEIRELVTGKLIYDKRVFSDLVVVVKAGKSDISAEDRVAGSYVVKDVIKK